MKSKLSVMVVSVMLCILYSSIQAALTDPYEILNRSYEASGGLENIKAQKTSYIEGKIDIVGAGITGTFMRWSQEPLKNRQVVDLKVMKIVSGDNGELAWSVDSNGKIQFAKDSVTLKERQVQKLMSDYDHLNRNSKNFKLAFNGIDTAAGAACYVVAITNSINTDTTITYYDTTSFLAAKSISIKPGGQTVSWFSDYREVNGIKTSFKQDELSLPTEQSQVVELTKVEMNQPMEASLFEPPKEDVKDFTFDNGKSAENIHFQFIENHIYLTVTINGKTSLWILDSGAGKSVVESDYATELGLKVEGNIKGQGAGKVVDVSFTTIPAYSVDGVSFKEQQIMAIKLKALFHKVMGLNVSGILGYDFLSRFVTRIDFAKEVISFYDPDSFVYSGDGKIIDAPISQDNMFHVPMTVDGKYSGLWNLDLGAGDMSFHYPYAESIGLLKRPGVDNMGFGAGGSMLDRDARFESIDFAGFKIDRPIISWPREKGQGAFSGRDLIGNIGNTLLRRFVLYLDYKNGRVIVEKGKDFEKTFPIDNSGLKVGYTENDAIEVIFVSPGTPADVAGLKVNDLLQSINGKNINEYDGVIGIRKLLKEKPGTIYELGIMRDNKPLSIKMTLKNLFD